MWYSSNRTWNISLVGLSVYNTVTPGNFFDPDSDTICIGTLTFTVLWKMEHYIARTWTLLKEKLCDYLPIILVKNQYTILKVFNLHISLDLGALWSKDCWGGL